MGWHRNHAISHSPNQNFFEDTFVSHPGGPNEQFGTHEKLSWGGVQGNLNWMPGYMYVKVFIVNVNKCQKPFFLERHINIVNRVTLHRFWFIFTLLIDSKLFLNSGHRFRFIFIKQTRRGI